MKLQYCLILICFLIASITIFVLIKRKKEKFESNYVFLDAKTDKIRTDIMEPIKWNKQRYMESNRRKIPIGLQEKN